MRVAVLVGLLAQQPAARLEVRDDELGHLVRAVPDELAVALDEEPGLVDGYEHGQLLAPPDLEVLGAAAGRDVDDARALVEHDPPSATTRWATSSCAGRSSKPVAYGRPTSSSPRTLPTIFASAPKTASQRSFATTRRSPSCSTQTYSASGLTVAATFAGSVQGVVVQTTRRLARGVGEAEAHVQRRIDEVAVGIRRCDFML